jgi:hypothetical protein
MTVIWVCAVLVLAGLAVAVRWGGLAVPPAPGSGEDQGWPLVARRYLWYVNVAVIAGLGAGLLIAGAGGRLAMRLLAVTAGPQVQGSLTEAHEVVGKITAGGTAGFILFTALFMGLPTGALYLLVRRWLPSGRLAGLAFGALLLVTLATRVDPLRAGNVDFDVVGPGWAAVVVFSALVLVHGMVVAGLAGWAGHHLPLLSRSPRAVAAYLPVLALVAFPPVAVLVVLVGAAVVLLSQARPVMAVWRSGRVLTAGWIALVVLLAVAIPTFTAAVADILGRP